MDREIFVPEIAKREENFFNGKLADLADFTDLEVITYFAELQKLAEDIAVEAQKQREIGKEQVLKTVFSRVYNYVISFNSELICSSSWDYSLFDENTTVYDDAFDACFFISLCMFLYDTRRVKGMSLRKFIYENSPQKYNVKGSPNYFNYDRPREFLESNSDMPQKSSSLIRSDEDKLRQYRKRLLDSRPVYHYSSEWSAIRKHSEHEWTLYFVLNEADAEIQDTAKRIRNLYKDIYGALNSEVDEKYIEKQNSADSKFKSKLKKIKYERFLNLGKFFLDHISGDKTCYGLNLYRFEKEMRLYRITSDVNRLLNCEEEAEARHTINLFIQMHDIVFPRLYEYFGNMSNVRHTQIYADTFWSFMNEVVHSSRLIIDKLVEDDIFGENWEQLFLETTNKLAELVLYDPSKINYSLASELQQKFQNYLLEPVKRIIAYQKGHFYSRQSLLSGSDSDDEI